MLLEPEVLKKSSEINPQVSEFIKANPSPALDYDDYKSFRTMLDGIVAMQLQQLGPVEAGLEEYKMKIPVRDGQQINIKIVKPSSAHAGGSPLIVLNFGGGFIGGNEDQMTPNSRAFARLFGAVVINTGYRLAPEYKFPTSQTDVYDAVKWAAAHASELGADPTKGFIVGGISAGGNTSAVATTLAVEEGLTPPLTGQWLSVPILMDTPPEKYQKYYLAREDNKEVPVLPANALETLAKFTQWDVNSPLRSPVLSKVPMSKLPPTFLQADGLDPLRDDTLIYEEMLKEAGVKTRINFYPGCPHAHWGFMPGLEISMTAIADIMTGMGWLLGKEITPQEGLAALKPKA